MDYWTSGAPPFALAGDPGDIVTLRSLLEEGYGAEILAEFKEIQLEYFADPKYPDPSYWDPENPSYTQILQNGTPVGAGTPISMSIQEALDTISFSAGNLIYANVSISFRTGDDSFQRVLLKTVPTALADLSNFDRVVTNQDIVAAARHLAETYNGVPNSNDCYFIADTIASMAGAPLPFQSGSPVPSQNVDGGYWQIIHSGSEDPIDNWQSLLQAGDIVRLEWANGSSPHSFTVTSNYNTGGRMEVVDNGGDQIHQHWVEYESKANPASITIYRISPDGLYLINGSEASEVLYGTMRSDDLRGFAGDDTVLGGLGDDKLDGGLGADRMIGGWGNDVFFVDNADDVVVEAIGQGYDRVLTSVDYKLKTGQEIEELAAAQAEGLAPLTLVGNALTKDIWGNAGDNFIRSGVFLYGLAGNDRYVVSDAGVLVFEAAGGGIDSVLAETSYALQAGQEIESLQLLLSTGAADFNLTGNEFAQAIRGNSGDNVLDGGGGADRLSGGAGDDTYITDGEDIIYEAANAGIDTVWSSVTYTLFNNNLENLTLLGNDAINGTGNAGANTIIGNSSGNLLDGRGGADTLIGGGGNDTFIVDDASDRVIEARGSGFDAVVSSVDYVLGGGQEIEVLQILASTGSSALDLTGNAFAQTLIGNNGANVLNGAFGNDVLIGQGGADTFVFANALGSNNVDHIADFAGGDTIRLSDDIFTALVPGQLAPGAFKNISTGTADASDRILYKQTTGELFYDADGAGGRAAVKFAVLDNMAALTAADFFVV